MNLSWTAASWSEVIGPVVGAAATYNAGQKGLLDSTSSKTPTESSGNKVKLPENESQIGHIFRDKDGHLPNTTVNRNLLESVANSQENYIGVDKYGSSRYAQTRSDGSQVWVQSRNGVITNGGVNSVPKIWDNETGLSLNLKDK